MPSGPFGAYPDRVGLIEAIIPTILAMIIFWIGLRAVIQADRRERAAQARFEAEEHLAQQQTEQVAPGEADDPAHDEPSEPAAPSGAVVADADR